MAHALRALVAAFPELAAVVASRLRIVDAYIKVMGSLMALILRSLVPGVADAHAVLYNIHIDGEDCLCLQTVL